ncbi:heme-degrading domain-containing protein [Szabonella alba]|uniref:Heme-degrading domain-containing protein n=1 Tax=Szabonella alba TaxID=2804194 RepID=A0A8K0V8X1_9RHOB|nr:heme-degrading domain-containing protein [Szabonella alba]MBL4917291.1 heme-degrading domain-containing protein [Szabonella alba]
MDIDALEARETGIVLDRFAEDTALQLGAILMQLAQALKAPLVIDIRDSDRTYFHVALPGSAPLNALWARRKSNTVLLMQRSSFLIGQRNAANGQTLARHGLDPADYADHGGAVPVRVRGVGVVAVATVSGLPQAEDHALVLEALEHLAAAQAG